MSWLKIHLQDEAPAIGSGRRLVFVHSVGHKYAVIRDPFTQRSARIQLPIWKQIARSAKPAQKPRGLRKTVTQLNRLREQKTSKAVRAMLAS